MAATLEVRSVTKTFGALHAIDKVDLTVTEGEMLGLIGPNGSGKTTLFNCISGFLRPSSRRVFWNGEDITHHGPDRIARSGLVRTFQQPMLFVSATVCDNVQMALTA